MGERIALLHPEYLNIVGPEGISGRGADQDWFRREWQRKAGCGPTAASVLMAYLARARGLEPLCPLEHLAAPAFVDYMEEVWAYVKPGCHGLNKVPMLTEGVKRFAAARGIELEPAALEVPPGEGRPDLSGCAAFIRAGLEDDCPVAFLNLHNGEESRLDAWHWVLITALEEENGGVHCSIVDSGKEFIVDLGLWHATTKDRGGFVFVPNAV